MSRWVWLAAGVVLGAVGVHVAGAVVINRWLDEFTPPTPEEN